MAVSAPIDLEVCVDSVESAIEAVKQGASTVELCFNNAQEGGYSPSIGLLKVVKSNINVPIFVVVRPHRTDYVYSDLEYEIMQEEVSLAKHIGASGFIFGILTSNNQVDIRRCTALIQLCRPLPCTFSRAFDYATNPVLALEDVIKCGFDRVLVGTERYSSNTPSNMPLYGSQVTGVSNTGANLLATLQEQAQSRIKIIPARKTAQHPDTRRSSTSEEMIRKNSTHSTIHEEQSVYGGGSFSLANLLTHPLVLNKLRTVDVGQLLVDLLRDTACNDRISTSSPLDSSPASPQMASVQRLRNISPSNDNPFKNITSPDNNGLEYVSAFNPLKPTIMVSKTDMMQNTQNQDNYKPLIQRRDSLQVPDIASLTGLSGVTRRRSLDDPSSANVLNALPMDTSEMIKECQTTLKKERSLSAPEALFYPSLADQVLAFKHMPDSRLIGGHQSAAGAACNMRTMLRMNVRRGPLQKKLDALKASTHIDEEYNAVMNVNENNIEEPNLHLNNSLREMEIADNYSMSFKRKRSYGPNQKKIDDSNLMHALKSGLEFNRTLKQESDFNVFKKEVETLYEGSECINERSIMCGRCGKTHHLSWLRYHQQFNTEHWVHCHPRVVSPAIAEPT